MKWPTFPYGKAPFWIMALFICSGLQILYNNAKPSEKTELTVATFDKNNSISFKKLVKGFEEENNVKVKIQLVEIRSLGTRIQSALLAGTEVPDLIEVEEQYFSGFTSGPLEDIGFVDLTDRIKAEKLDQKLVTSRFALWSSRGRVFGLPNDVHPVVLAYRWDIVERLGIDVEKDLQTWDDFVKVGKQVSKDFDGDGVLDRYMIDLPREGAWGLQTVLLQAGGNFFDKAGKLVIDSSINVEVIKWYVNLFKKYNIAFSAGWGQTLAKTQKDGLALFYITPDWRSGLYQQDTPVLSGKFKLMPMPAWEKGGRRTATWGGSCMVITKYSKQQDLAWKLAKHLYLNENDRANRFKETYIIPPFKDAWQRKEFSENSPFYANQKIGKLFIELSDEIPDIPNSPFMQQAKDAVNRTCLNAMNHYEENGEEGLEEFIKQSLKKGREHVEKIINRNKFHAKSS